MTLYVLMKRNADYSVVNDDMDVVGGPPEEIVDIFATEEAANTAKAECEKQAQADVDEFGCDLDEYFIDTRQLRYSPFE